ncbi:hypothetical protein GGS26DRAFT_561608 [Hypomontagnella submonticulosa]|nr:hypothetical protein GGS26DRAFT_561608 [Hypomontagnella submonticulosa]
MISFNRSCLQSRHVALHRAWVCPQLIIVPSRASSLSAIHRGLRSSEKARPQGFKQASLNTAGPGRTPRHGGDFPSARPTFKIRKGKKDIADTGPKPKTRRARFHDPDEPFGKKSLVYQLKSGALRENLAKLTKTEQPTGHRRDDRLTQGQFGNEFRSSPRNASPPGERERRPQSFVRARQPEERARLQPSSRFGGFNSVRKPAWDEPPKREIYRGKQDSQPLREEQTRQGEEQTAIRRVSPRDTAPVRIPRTTAASQFLYGHSVVEAALKETRRQLYKLYLYCGENRRDTSRITELERWASRAGVAVTKVMDSDGLRMMDKMSDGRPHNGCVLEASPLPQLPLKALGSWVEEPAAGFSLELAYQSAEEVQVNGTSNFIKCSLPPGRKPFVLLLDGIQDPGNLGAILRSAAFLGVNAVAITKGNSATLTAVALKASAGASELMQLFSVNSVLDFLTRSKEVGWVVYAAVAPTDRPRGSKHVALDRIDTYDPLSTDPTILVIGSEGEGLTTMTRRMADFEVSIPNHSGFAMVDSLNVSVATGILCSAFLKKQHSGDKFDKVLDNQEDGSREQLW